MAELNATGTVTETQEEQTTELTQEETTTEGTSKQEETTETNQESQKKSVEDMLSELMAENARLKREKDKASQDAAKYKRESMANKSEAEQKAIEKAEEDARIKEELAELRKESALNKLEKSFVSLGYSEDMAKQAAEAQYDGNTDLLFQIQKKFFAEKERAIKAELMRKMPGPSISNEDGISVTKEQFNAMTYRERLELSQKYPRTYEQLRK